MLVLPACRREPSARDSTAPAASTKSEASVAASTSAIASAAPSTSASAAPPEPPDAPYPVAEPSELLANGELGLHDWKLPGDPKIARRAVVLVPRHLTKKERVPLLVLLHGLAETVDEEMGAYAWVKRYGAAEGYAHLRAPATITRDGLGKMATDERCAEIRTELSTRPFGGMVIACPYTPNIWKTGASVEAAIDAHTQWIFDVLLPRLYAETPVLPGREHLGVDGVSLGGYASLGVGVRRAQELGSIGCVQAAISVAEAPSWADRLEKAFAKGARPLHLMTSTLDVFRKPVEALDAALTARKVAHDFRLAIGPHDQPFLRGPGSLEMLLWHARQLG